VETAKPYFMISFEEALNIVLSHGKTIGTEHIPLQNCLNRTLSEDILSDIDMPPFNKSAMDGYACRKEDLDNELEVIEEIPAGKVPVKRIEKNQCSRIMTGAMVPEGADFVLMQEHAEEVYGKITCSTKSNHANICYCGEDVKKGDVVLEAGLYILPQHIAVLASVGAINPLVYKIPSVSVISTGNELVEPNQKPMIAQIRNSNGYQLISQVVQRGITPNYLGIVKDNKILLQQTLTIAIENHDLILISGGVSVGDYDYVPQVLNDLGVEILFHGLTAKPGKHLLFGKKDHHFIFGLPGNPVSSFVQFELLVRPFINGMMGKATRKSILELPLEESYIRKKNHTLDFIPVKITPEHTALPIDYHGSAHIHSYTKADAIMEIPIGVSQIIKGEIVHVRPL
jgi:molybdopterin molybdotransferase